MNTMCKPASSGGYDHVKPGRVGGGDVDCRSDIIADVSNLDVILDSAHLNGRASNRRLLAFMDSTVIATVYAIGIVNATFEGMNWLWWGTGILFRVRKRGTSRAG